MPPFIHTIADEARIREVLRLGSQETEQLEFKALWGPWSKAKSADARFEPMKDIAALANATGGDILVGVSQRDGRAAGLCLKPEDDRPGAVGELLGWVASYLHPPEIATTIRVEAVKVSEPDGEVSVVFVVSVPPWPNGVVSVRSGPDLNVRPRNPTTPTAFVFPKRVESHTHYLDLDEAMHWMNPRSRALYLRILDLIRGGRTRVRLITDVWVWPDSSSGSPGVVREGKGNGNLAEAGVQEATITVQMDGHWPGLTMMGAKDPEPHGQGRLLVIPYSLLGDAWPAPDLKTVLNMHLLADVVWAAGEWHLRPHRPATGG